MWLVLFGQLSRPCRLYSMLGFLIEPAIVSNAVLPLPEVVLQLVLEEVLPIQHLAILPLRLIHASVGIDECAVSMELSLDEVPFINNSVGIGITPLAMVPSFLVLSLIKASAPR